MKEQSIKEIDVERRRRETLRSRYFAITAILIGLAASIVGFIYSSTRERSARLAVLRDTLPADFALRVQNDVQMYVREVAELKKTVAALSTVPEGSQVAATLKRLSEESNLSGKRIKALEDVILDSPEKAISIPLVRKDLDTQRNTTQAELAAIRAEIARIYDFNKWFFGLIATMALSTLGFAASSLLKKKQSDDEAA